MFSIPGLAQFTTSSGTGAQFYSSVPPASIVSGAGPANVSTAGMTALVSAYQDDTGNPWNLPMDFYFLGTNYGRNLNGGMCWNSNFVIGFSLSSGVISWPASQPGVLIGNADRATNSFFYSSPLTYGSATYVNCVAFGQNLYSDGLANALKYQIRLIRDPVYQYIEIRVQTGASTAGTWRVAGGPGGGNVFIATGTAVGTGQSGVWRSTITGSNWTWFSNSYVSIP